MCGLRYVYQPLRQKESLPVKYYQYCYRSFFNYYFNIFLYCSDYIITIMVLGTLGGVIACAAHPLVVEPYCYYCTSQSWMLIVSSLTW